MLWIIPILQIWIFLKYFHLVYDADVLPYNTNLAEPVQQPVLNTFLPNATSPLNTPGSVSATASVDRVGSLSPPLGRFSSKNINYQQLQQQGGSPRDGIKTLNSFEDKSSYSGVGINTGGIVGNIASIASAVLGNHVEEGTLFTGDQAIFAKFNFE